MDNIGLFAFFIWFIEWALVVGLSVRIIMRRRPIGILLAWLAIIYSVPIVGILLYLSIGENRVSEKYRKRAAAVHGLYTRWQQSLRTRSAVNWSDISLEAFPLHQQAETVFGFPALQGNQLELLTDYQSVFQNLIDDINQSKSTCHLEFYIWHTGGLADQLADAVIHAAQRGVICRVLVDAVGSEPFLSGNTPTRLKAAGVRLGISLPVGIFSTLFSRADLRNHRKIVVVDGLISYTGSQNLVDPRHFKQDEGVGQWIDAMMRIQGPVVESLGGIFIQDWEIVTGIALTKIAECHDVTPVEEQGAAPVQAIPSGPSRQPLAILQILLSMIYAARHELVITTPYFIPDDSLLIALISAAQRGVSITLIIPEKNDSRLADYASRAVFDDLLAAGITIAAFRGGLLHTKSITVDGEFCLFGSVNLDMRSLWLNFEISLLIYNRDVTNQLRELQSVYISDSDMLDASEWAQRSIGKRLLENACHLAAPLL